MSGVHWDIRESLEMESHDHCSSTRGSSGNRLLLRFDENNWDSVPDESGKPEARLGMRRENQGLLNCGGTIGIPFEVQAGILGAS